MKRLSLAVAAVMLLTACEYEEGTIPLPIETPPTVKSPSKVETIPGEIEDGMYTIPDEVKPGTYQTMGPRREFGRSFCYWERLKGTSGEISDVIANDAISGKATVTIKKSDVAFKTDGCETWVKVQ